MSISVGIGVGLTFGRSRGFNPYDLFLPGDNGFLYDFSRADTLFQEATGTTPTGVDQNVGLALDISKWGGKTLAQVLAGQPDLIAPLDLTSGWTPNGTAVVVAPNSFSASTNSGITKNLGLTTGKTYRCDIVYAKSDASTVFVCYNNNAASGTAASSNMAAASGRSTIFFVATSPHFFMRINGSATVTVSSISVKEIPGNHASQGTSGARPVMKAGGLTRYDGSDDNLLTTLVPSAAMTLAFKGKVTSASKGIISSRTTSTDAVELAINASGNLIGNVGSATSAGTSDIRGVTGVGVLVFDASTSKLYWNGSQIDSGPRSGSVNTTVPFRIGCRNTSGTGSIFADADIYKILAINRALTPAEIVKLTNAWSH